MGEYAVEKREITPKNFLLVIFQQYRKQEQQMQLSRNMHQ